MKSVILVYKQRSLLYYDFKKSITEKNTLLFTYHSHQFLISINQKHGYMFFT